MIQDILITMRNTLGNTYPLIKNGNYTTRTGTAAIMVQVEAFINPPRTGTDHLNTVITTKTITPITKAISNTRPVIINTLMAGFASIPQVSILIDLKVLNRLTVKSNQKRIMGKVLTKT